jgi:hypothetical protein
MAYDLVGRRERCKSTVAIGYVPDYVIYEPDAVEAVWRVVEDQLPAAFAAVDDGTIFSNARLVAVLTDALALHSARSKAYKNVHNLILDRVVDRQKTVFRERGAHLLESAFVDRYGRAPEGSADLDHINDLIHDDPPQVVDGSWFATRVQY